MSDKEKHLPQPPSPDINSADADGSEERPNPFSALDNDDAEVYDPTRDNTEALEKNRIHDK